MLIPRLHTAATIGAWSTAGVLFACVLDNPAYDGEGGTSSADEGETTSGGSNGGVTNGGVTNDGVTSGGLTSVDTSAGTSTTTTAGDDTSTSAGPSCADLTCDPHASCVDGSDGPVCECAPGFIGDGLTCADVDECADDELCGAGVCVNHDGGYACTFPASCAELKEAQPEADDGHHTLYLDGDMARPWTAFCYDMAQTPLEYLTLPQQGNGSNTSRYTVVNPYGGYSGELAMQYQRIRINPATLRVNVGNTTFTTTAGTALFNGMPVNAVGYGIAITCVGGTTSANIDLRGTPFDAQAGQWCTDGYMPNGSTDTPVTQVYVNYGGGDCGWRAPGTGGCPNTPINKNSGGDHLQLIYIGG